MRRKAKRDLSTGILRYIATTALVPERLNDLYYSALEAFQYKDLPTLLQPVAILAAWYQVKIFDVLDRRYLYGQRFDLPDEGTPVHSIGDMRDKQTEIELLPKLQKGLLECVQVLRSNSKGTDIGDPFAKLGEALDATAIE